MFLFASLETTQSEIKRTLLIPLFFWIVEIKFSTKRLQVHLLTVIDKRLLVFINMYVKVVISSLLWDG